jgi:hypothetical protein
LKPFCWLFKIDLFYVTEVTVQLFLRHSFTGKSYFLCFWVNQLVVMPADKNRTLNSIKISWKIAFSLTYLILLEIKKLMIMCSESIFAFVIDLIKNVHQSVHRNAFCYMFNLRSDIYPCFFGFHPKFHQRDAVTSLVFVPQDLLNCL